MFSSPTNKRNTIILDREREPEFHAFVETIAESVGAPAPWRIEIDHLANASASYHRLPIDLFRRRMILTLGAPLIACMNTRQLAGIIAHEFGHFSQRLGMGTVLGVMHIALWFIAGAGAGGSEYDAEWDEQLEASIEESPDANLFIAIPILISVLLHVVIRLVMMVFRPGRGHPDLSHVPADGA